MLDLQYSHVSQAMCLMTADSDILVGMLLLAKILKKKKMLQTLLGSSLPGGAHSSRWWGGKTVIGATSADYKLDGLALVEM